ncbi:MAG TPA: fused MFS/spermidine synthase [Pirellulales bacterium]
MKTADIEQRTSRNIFWLASLMFCLSGGTGLAYQVIWFKRFAHVWGSSSLAFAAVGGSFLFGLGVGAYLLGRYADRVLRPLRWYGCCELAIGALAIVIPLQIQFLVEQSAGFYWRLPGDPLLRFLLQFVVTLLVVGPPCVLMGGTLPLLIRELTARDGRLDQATGWLYAINTFGAAAGCFLTGFWLLPQHGLVVANYLAAAVNISIGAVAVYLTQRVTQPQRKSAPTARVPTAAAISPAIDVSAPGLSLLGLYVAVTLSGLGALILEMTWSRQLALLLGGSAYTYSATLFVVLIGIAVGSLTFHLFLRRYAFNPWLPVIVIGALALSCLIAALLMPQLALALMVDLRKVNTPNLVNKLRQTLSGNALVCVTASACLELIPSIAMGILFPLFVDLTRASAARVGRTVGDVYAWNTLGSIFGATLTAVVLFPWIGTYGSIALATGLYVVTLVLVLPLRSGPARMLAAGCLAVGAAVVGGILIPHDPLRTNLGMYMYGNPLEKPSAIQQNYFAEGASCNVLVATSTVDGVRNLRVNGKVDASDGLDMVTQSCLAYVPRILKPDARDVMVIGFGSGTTSGVSLMFPGTHVTCCEIEPAVYSAASYFAHVNHRPHEQTREALQERNAALPEPERRSDAQIDEQARFKMIFGDGRTTLQGSDQKYDLIISEPSNPWLAGVSNLFTREFFRAARTHLKPGGVLAQWVQTYNLKLDEYNLILRTLRSEFPNCVICTGIPSDTLLLASEEPIDVDPAALERLQKVVNDTPEIREDLIHYFGLADLRMALLRHFCRDEKTLDFGAGVGTDLPLNTDSNLLLEFLAPLHLFTSIDFDASAVQIAKHPDLAALDRWAKSLNIMPKTVDYEIMSGLRDAIAFRPTDALGHFQEALRIDPHSQTARDLIVRSLKDTRDLGLTVATLSGLVKTNPDEESLVLELATALGRNKEDVRQREVLLEYAARVPQNVPVRDALSRYFVARNEHAAAFEVLRQMAELQPQNPVTQAQVAQELLALRRPAESIAYFRKALELSPAMDANNKSWLWANNIAWINATSTDPALRDGPEAVRLAKQALDAAGPQQPGLVDTLACAYAENGQFDEAVRYAKENCEQLKSAGAQAPAIQAAEDRIKLFETGQPYREP